VVTERLVLRCWEPGDAPGLKEAVDSSLDDLRPWMPWAEDEPESLEQKVELLRGFRGRFDLDQDYVYGVFTAGGEDVVGGSGLHTRHGSDALEIGYWIRSNQAGKGFATELTAALTRAAFELCEVDRVEIRTDPANERSRTVPSKVGYEEEATLRRRLHHPEPRDVVIYSMFRDRLAGTAAADARFEAYDVLGERMWPR
jgi:RimJ/RimL family protein N-acetyltransferase